METQCPAKRKRHAGGTKQGGQARSAAKAIRRWRDGRRRDVIVLGLAGCGTNYGCVSLEKERRGRQLDITGEALGESRRSENGPRPASPRGAMDSRAATNHRVRPIPRCSLPSRTGPGRRVRSLRFPRRSPVEVIKRAEASQCPSQDLDHGFVESPQVMRPQRTTRLRPAANRTYAAQGVIPVVAQLSPCPRRLDQCRAGPALKPTEIGGEPVSGRSSGSCEEQASPRRATVRGTARTARRRSVGDLAACSRARRARSLP